MRRTGNGEVTGEGILTGSGRARVALEGVPTGDGTWLEVLCIAGATVTVSWVCGAVNADVTATLCSSSCASLSMSMLVLVIGDGGGDIRRLL